LDVTTVSAPDTDVTMTQIARLAGLRLPTEPATASPDGPPVDPTATSAPGDAAGLVSRARQCLTRRAPGGTPSRQGSPTAATHQHPRPYTSSITQPRRTHGCREPDTKETAPLPGPSGQGYSPWRGMAHTITACHGLSKARRRPSKVLVGGGPANSVRRSVANL